MKGFEVLNRLAWLWLVVSFLTTDKKQKFIFQITVFVFLVLSFIFEIFSV